VPTRNPAASGHLDATGRLHGGGETTEQAALREVWEESGVRAEIVSPYSIFSVPKISEVYIIFRAIALEDHRPVRAGDSRLQVLRARGHSLGQIYYPAIRQILERYIEERQAGVYGIYMGNDDTGKIHFIRYAPLELRRLTPTRSGKQLKGPAPNRAPPLDDDHLRPSHTLAVPLRLLIKIRPITGHAWS
jgi:ADP-ribose pyrophosphatase YjhB (NUDIX family)